MGCCHLVILPSAGVASLVVQIVHGCSRAVQRGVPFSGWLSLCRLKGSASLSVELGRCCTWGRETASGRMETSALWAPAPKQKVTFVEREGPGWTVSLDSQGDADCPICGTRSSSRHGSYIRSLQDLPAQGMPVLIQARVTRWRCLNDRCERRTFAERRLDLTAPFARRTTRMAGIVRLFGHAAEGGTSVRTAAGTPGHAGRPHHHFTTCKARRPGRAGDPPRGRDR
jgi:hypothetical protein